MWLAMRGQKHAMILMEEIKSSGAESASISNLFCNL